MGEWEWVGFSNTSCRGKGFSEDKFLKNRRKYERGL